MDRSPDRGAVDSMLLPRSWRCRRPLTMGAMRISAKFAALEEPDMLIEGTGIDNWRPSGFNQ